MANVATLTAKMALDASGFQRGVTQVTSGLNSLSTSAIKAARDVDGILPARADSRMAAFGNGLHKVNSELDAFAQRTREAHATPLQQYSTQLFKLNTAFSGGLIGVQTYNAALATARQKFIAATTPIVPMVPQVNRLGVAMSNFGQSLLAGIGMGSAYAGVMTVLSGSLRAVEFAASKAFQVLSIGFTAAMESEQSTIAFKTMLGSMEGAVKLKKQIESFALATPFDVKGTTDAVRLLKARNTATNELLPTLKTLGDLAMGDAERLKHLALAYSQVMAKNKLMAQEANLQFPEAGINIVKAVADEMGKTVPEVVKLMEEGAISAAVVRNALITLAETNFAGSLEDQAKTAMGALNRLREVGILTLKDMAEGLMTEFSIGANLNDLASMAEVFRDEVAPQLVDGLSAIANEFLLTAEIFERTLDRMERSGLISAGMGAGTGTPSGGFALSGTLAGGLAAITGIGSLEALDRALGSMDPAGKDGKGTFRSFIEDMRNAVFDQRINDAYFNQEGLKKAPIPGAATAVTSALGSLFKGTGNSIDSLIFNAGIKGGRGIGFLESLLPKEAVKAREFKPTGAIEAGSREAMSAIVRNMLGGEKKGMDEKQLKAAQDAVKLLDKILSETVKAGRDVADVIGSFSG